MLLCFFIATSLSKFLENSCARFSSAACDLSGLSSIRSIAAFIGKLSVSLLVCTVVVAVGIILYAFYYYGVAGRRNFPISGRDIWISIVLLSAVLATFVGAAGVFFGTMYVITFGVFVYFICLMIRFTASACYLKSGVAAFPHNFKRLVLCTSPIHRPELVPGLIPTAPTSDSRLFPTVAFSDSLVSGCDSRR